MTIGTTLVIVFFALLWGWLIYEMHIAPELDDDGNIKIDIKDEDFQITYKNKTERNIVSGVVSQLPISLFMLLRHPF